MLLLSPVFNQLQNLVGQFLLLLLIGVTCALDEEQAVLAGCRHVRVDISQEARRVAIGKVVVGADKQGTRMCYPGNLMEVPDSRTSFAYP